MIWFALAFAAAVPEELAVSVTTPRCELRARVPDALGRAVPGVAIVEASAEARPSRVRFSVQVGSRVAHAVFVRLLDERGAVVLVREVPLQGQACTAAADGVAVIVARHLRSLGWVPPAETGATSENQGVQSSTTAATAPAETPAIESSTIASIETRASDVNMRSEPPAPPETRAIDPIAAEPTEPVPPPTAPTATATGSFELHLELGAALFLGPDVLGAEARAHLAHAPFELTLAAGYSPRSNERDVLREGRAEPIGTVAYRSWHALAGLGACAPLFAIRACALAEAGAEIFTATAQGPRIFQRDDQTLTRPVAQASARLEWSPIDRLSLFLSAGLRYRPLEAELAIEDAIAPIVPARWTAVGTLGARLRIF